MSKGKTKPKKTVTKRERKPDPPKPIIDPDLLNAFLHAELTLGEAAKIKRVESKFLWGKDVERYRINVWMAETHSEDPFGAKNYIGKSYYLHYDRKGKSIADKTIKKSHKT